MEQPRPHRPRVSRETRLLLITAFVALMALWMLARIRYPDRPAATPVQPLLTQLGSRARLEDLAAEITQVRSRIEPLLVDSSLRVRNDAALTLLDTESLATGTVSERVLGVDPASGLAVVQVPFLPAPPPVAWTPGDPQQARYFVAADVSSGMLALHPVFVGSLVPITTPLWADPIWLVPEAVALEAGMFVFTTDGLLAGIVIELSGRRAIVPGALLLSEANRLATPTAAARAETGIAVQALTPALTRATGATAGVVVSWVDPQGPAADVLEAGDVIHRVDNAQVTSPLDWQTRARRAAPGRPITVGILRDGQLAEVTLTPAAIAAPPAGELGLTLRTAPGNGSVVTEVQAGSAADRAGLRTGDVITRAGPIASPSPAAIRRTFDASAPDKPVLVAYTRGTTHAVTALEK